MTREGSFSELRRMRHPLWWVAPISATSVLTAALGCWLLTRDYSAAADGVAAALIVAGLISGGAVWWGAVGVRRIAREAADSSRRLDYAAQTGHELIWEIDPDGTVTYMSDVAHEMFGTDPAELIGQSVFLLLPPAEQQRGRALLADAIRERRGWSGLAFEALHSDGVLRWVETTSVAHLNEEGEVRSFTATTRRMDAEDVARREQDAVRARIERVLTERAVTTVFQPIVEVGRQRIIGYEALSRFADEPLQPPDRWFADARTVGLVQRLDCLAIRVALSAAWQLPEDAYVSINVTPGTLESDCLWSLLPEIGFPGERIVVEITEHVSVQDYRSLRDPINKLRQLGVRIAVDDAGSGYASFRHILRLKPEFIKLDQEIISDIPADPARRALAAAVAYFASEVGATVVAEGVETDEELRTVSSLGIGVMQGFLLGRPTADARELQGQLRRFSGTAPAR
jgi:PAS domain S-box-containing protein